MTSPAFKADIHDDFVQILLHEKRGIIRKIEIIPVNEWQNTLPEIYLPILAVLDSLVDEFDGRKSEDSITLPHESIVGLTESQASILGLPPTIPFAFDIRANGMIDQPGFSLTARWVTPGGVPEFIERKGAFAFKGHIPYRIPSPVYEIVKAAEVLSGEEANDNESRYKALAVLHDILPKDEQGNKVRVDKFIGSIRVLHASSFSLQIPTDGQSFQFNPVLFSRKAAVRAEEDARILDEAENLLTPNLQQTFSEKRFKQFQEARDCYTVDNGVYVYVDPNLKKALGVVRKMQSAGPEERRAFIRSPQRVIKEQLGENIAADTVDRIFVETEQYAQNVIGLGIWQPPVIPWLIKKPNSWLPEKFGLQIGNAYVQIKPEDLDHVREEISKNLQGFSGQPQAPFIYVAENGPVEIPVTKETESILNDLIGYAKAVQNVRVNNDDKPTPEQEALLESKAGPIFLLVNEDWLDNPAYKFTHPNKRIPSPIYKEPGALKSTLKSHQKEGLKWLIDSWTQGAPGVLLADDMGLGKTLQALTFLAWIKERKWEGHIKCKEPVLIVAPTGLLNNWQREIEIHLREPYLGENGLCEAYGSKLCVLREGKQNDLITGRVNLSRDDLRGYDVILTTYETYRDYHHSFAGIRFSAVVLDECQKIKNPKSQVNRALASMNAEFVVAMTGTPIENAIEDLWSIIERAWPGFLGDLKTFSSTHLPENRQALAELTAKVKGPATPEISTPVLWRRMKEDILDDLPKKIIHPLSEMQVTMPREQADAYLQVVHRSLQQEPPPMLHTLHALRGISLHPIEPGKVLREANFISYDQYIRGSARLSKAIEILDKVQSCGEKALMFIETIDMQILMADIIKKRYGLSKKTSIINGKTPNIQKLVDDFQDDPNFDVMILSPKVGGVGLTLTAANHVIHLSRWWNPAVEDQSTDRVYRIGQKKDVHVYYPMAVHPDMHVRESSFDLKLNALLERKRKLSRDMLIPVEDPADTENLFKEVVGLTADVGVITIEELDRMGDKEFERWALHRANQCGYLTEATNVSWDKGAYGIIKHRETGERFILQCKHSGRDIIQDDRVIEDLLRAREAYDPDACLVALTNSSFSKPLVNRMKQLRIRIYDRNSICTWPRL
jgi:hypothetical protein